MVIVYVFFLSVTGKFLVRASTVENIKIYDLNSLRSLDNPNCVSRIY